MTPPSRRRALILAGGGIRVAWQAGAVQALDEAGLRFDHGDGTSGGIFTLGMLLSGVEPAALGERWRSLPVRRFVSFLPWRDYARSPTNWRAVGGASGIVEHVLPGLGIDVERIRSHEGMSGSFNVADFDAKSCIAIPHDEIDLERLVAGVSLPVFLPAVQAGGRTWTDAVWIKDANLLEAVRRGCTELWVLWCIANAPYWGNGPLEQYVHMIELSANGALGAELEQIAEINERRNRGEPVHGTTDPVVVHVVKPVRPLPLDPDFVTGRITAETLVAMGYRDACRTLAEARPAALDASATRTDAAALGARVTLRLRGQLAPAGEALRIHVVVEAADLARFVADPAAGTPAVGAVDHPGWGYRPFSDATFTARRDDAGGLRFVLDAGITIDGAPHRVELDTVLPTGPGRWKRASRFAFTVRTAGSVVATGEAVVSRADALRALLAFEPSGAHDLRDRYRVARAAVGFLRRR